MQPARLSPSAAMAAACAGAAAWTSAGTLALTESGARAGRIGVLMSPWWLLALVAAALAAAWLLRLTADRARPLFASAVLFLPWLPVPIPPALLVWAGPVAWFVWAAIAAVMLAAGGWPRAIREWMAPWVASPSRAPWAALLCALLVYTVSSVRLAPMLPGGDEPHYLIIAQSLWRDGDLAIENNHQRGDYLEYFGGTLRPDYLRRGQDGRIYSIHMPGVSALIAPVLALGGHPLVMAVLAFASAITTAVAWRLAFALSRSVAAAWFGWASVAITAPFLLLAFTVYPDGAGAMAVLLSFAGIVSVATRPGRGPGWWLAAGVLPAMLPWFHPRFAVLAAALGLVFAGRALHEPRRWSSLASFACLPAASAIGWFGYYLLIYGRSDPSIAYGHYTQMTLGRMPVGLTGLLVDQQYGLLTSAPVYGVAAIGLLPFLRRHTRLALEWLLIAVPYAMVTAMYFMWWGGLSSPARFIGSTFLLWSVPAAMAFAAVREKGTRAVLAAVLATSVGVAALFVLAEQGQFAFNLRAAVAPWLVWMGQAADLGRGLPGLFRTTPAVAFVESAVWVAALVGAWALVRLAAVSVQLEPGAAALAQLAGGAAAVMLAITLVWQIEGAAGLSATIGQLRALEARGRGRAAIGVVFDPLSLTTPGMALERARVGLERPADTPSTVWLLVPQLPAGRYRLWVDHRALDGAFDAQIHIGRTEVPIERWHADRLNAGSSSFELDIPVPVRSLLVTGSEASHRAVRAMWLQPVKADPAPFAAAERAAGAARYDALVLYGLGGGVYVEPGGIWTAGGREATLVLVAAGASQANLSVGAGAVATPVTLVAGDFVVRLDLQAGERRDVTIPLRQGGPVLVRVRAERGFRPSETDPQSTDARWLGVRLEAAR